MQLTPSLTLVLASLLLLVGPSATAQTSPSQTGTEAIAQNQGSESESISVGGVTLRLGMAQNDVLLRLHERYYTELTSTPTATTSAWFVTAGPDLSAQVLGSVTFERQRLTAVYKYWGLRPYGTPLAFADALYSAVKNMEEESEAPCEIRVAAETTVFITCKGLQKYLEFSTFSSDKGRQVTGLTEVLEYPQEEAAAKGAAVPASDFSSSQTDAELSDPSALVLVRPSDRLTNSDLARVSEHNRALCDQIVTVAGLTPNGLVLYVPPEGQKFMAKNSQHYPRMCLMEDAASLVPGVPRYLLVYAYSANAFAGFQPITQVNSTTTPVSGSGTGTNSYGEMWNFSYFGTVETTEIDTMEEPYVIQSRSLYLNAYDENGVLVSKHSITLSRQVGGNGASALGYNGVQLITMLWNNPSRLVKSVLKDVQKDSAKYKN